MGMGMGYNELPAVGQGQFIFDLAYAPRGNEFFFYIGYPRYVAWGSVEN